MFGLVWWRKVPGTDTFTLLIARKNALTLVWVALSKARGIAMSHFWGSPEMA